MGLIDFVFHYQFDLVLHYETGDSERIGVTRHLWQGGEGSMMDRHPQPPKVFDLNPLNQKWEYRAAKITKIEKMGDR